MKRCHTFLFALMAATVAGATVAAPQAGQGMRQKLDANNDGAIDRAEAAVHPRLAQHFDRLDANRDGRLDRAERPGHHGARRGGHLERVVALDTNRDGRISRIEAGDSKLGKRFDRYDANRDGYVVRRELQAGMERRRTEMKREREQRAAERFREADRNRDGRLSQDEVAQGMPRVAKAFAFLDDNRDGFLVPGELRFGRHGR